MTGSHLERLRAVALLPVALPVGSPEGRRRETASGLSRAELRAGRWWWVYPWSGREPGCWAPAC
ncbi:hypothetical protein [Saccharothrix sp. NRRL B-16314]|uniref:hypothetical protein n=1 Tax=Saccharothrix sp. NRRL B-16314 TaxID=1463825 RepID=UPI0005245360|nr:hypothetical protein [Saccharothrix sp. NRRL B-16314]